MSTPRFVVHTAAIAFLAGVAAFSQAQKAGDSTPTAAPAALNGPVIKVAQGEAQGITADGVTIYKGLPFATPPVGDLRVACSAASREVVGRARSERLLRYLRAS